MKKVFSVLICIALVLSFAACGKESAKKPAAEITLDKTELKSGETLKISVRSENMDFDRGPWIGIVPAGEYKTGDDADNADVWYAYLTSADQAEEFDADGLPEEDGKWLVVVCSGDGESAEVIGSKEFSFTYVKPDDPEKEDKKPEEGEHDPAYWADFYGESICPFYFIVEGIEDKEYFRAGGSLQDWIYTENNTLGWYNYGDLVVSYDGKYAIGPDIDWFSSFCDYEAYRYDGPTLSEEEQKAHLDGVLYVLNSYTPIVTNWGIDLMGPEDDRSVELKCRGIRCDFNKDDDIRLFVNFSLDDDETCNAELFVLPHQTEGYGMKLSEELAKDCFAMPLDRRPDEDTPNAEIKLSEEQLKASGDGKFDIVLTYDDMVICYVTVNIK